MRPLKGKNMADLRKSNRARVLEVLFRHGPISRAEISEITGLTPPAVTALANELIGEGLLAEAGLEDGKATVGRKRIKLQLIADSMVAVGVEIGIKHLSLGLVDLNGRIFNTTTLNIEDSDPDAIIKLAASGIERIARDYAAHRVIGVGVGATGLVDGETGIVRYSPNIGWHDVPLRRLLEERLKLSVVVDNNVRLMALGENMFFHNQGDVARLALIHADYGIGCGFTVNGELYYGRGFAGGELGHTIILPEGPPCICGKKGCLETVASGRAITTRYAEKTNRGKLSYRDGLQQLLAAGAKNEKAAVEILAEAGMYMGIGLTNLATVLAPDLIVLHGPVFKSDIYARHMAEQIESLTRGEGEGLSIVSSRKQGDLVILGAGALTIQKLLIDDASRTRLSNGGGT